MFLCSVDNKLWFETKSQIHLVLQKCQWEIVLRGSQKNYEAGKLITYNWREELKKAKVFNEKNAIASLIQKIKNSQHKDKWNK